MLMTHCWVEEPRCKGEALGKCADRVIPYEAFFKEWTYQSLLVSCVELPMAYFTDWCESNLEASLTTVEAFFIGFLVF